MGKDGAVTIIEAPAQVEAAAGLAWRGHAGLRTRLPFLPARTPADFAARIGWMTRHGVVVGLDAGGGVRSAPGHHGRADGPAEQDHADRQAGEGLGVLAGRLHDTDGAELYGLVRVSYPGRPGARVDRAAAEATSPLAAIEAMFLAHVDFVARHPGVPRILFGELQRADDTPAKRMVRTIIERYRERLVGLLDRGKAAGVCSADLDSAAAAMLFIGSIQGLVMSSMLAGDVERVRRDAPGAFAILRRGFGAQQ